MNAEIILGLESVEIPQDDEISLQLMPELSQGITITNKELSQLSLAISSYLLLPRAICIKYQDRAIKDRFRRDKSSWNNSSQDRSSQDMSSWERSSWERSSQDNSSQDRSSQRQVKSGWI